MQAGASLGSYIKCYFLHAAARARRNDCKDSTRQECGEKLIQLVLDTGIDIDSTLFAEGDTAMIEAIGARNEVEANCWLRKGANPLLECSNLGSPREFARKRRSKFASIHREEDFKRIEDILVENTAKLRESAIHPSETATGEDWDNDNVDILHPDSDGKEEGVAESI